MLSSCMMIRLSSDRAPSEFRLFVFGENRTRKGVFLLTRESALECMKRYREHGVDLSIDWDHAQLDPSSPVSDRRAAGWCRLELRDDGLWAVSVRWTDEARDAIERREWRYTSPAFLVDDRQQIIEIINVALTNLPATDQIQPLVANRFHVHSKQVERLQMDEGSLQLILQALGLPADASIEDILAAIDRLKQAASAQSQEQVEEKRGEDQQTAAELHRQLSAAMQRIAQLEKQYADAQCTALTQQAVAEQRLSREQAAKLLARAGGSVDMIKTVLDLLPPLHQSIPVRKAIVPPVQLSSSVLPADIPWSQLKPSQRARILQDAPALALQMKEAEKKGADR